MNTPGLPAHSVSTTIKITMSKINVRQYLHPEKERSCVDFLITTDQKDEMLEAFTLFDKDGDGLISTKEISDVIRALGHPVTVCEETDIIAKFAQDKCYQIDFLGFYRLMINWRKAFNEDNELRECFRRFDEEDHGYVDVCELKRMLTVCGEPLRAKEVEDWLNDGERFIRKGRLYYEEFATYMLSK